MAEFDVEAEAARVSQRVEQTAERAQAQTARTGRITGQAGSADGDVRIEVEPGGLLTDVHLTRGALRVGPDALARQIMELADVATRRAGDRMYRALAPELGAGGQRQLNSLGYEQLPDDDEPVEFDSPLTDYGR